MQANRINRIYVWARAGAAVKTVAIVKITKAGMRIRASFGRCARMAGR